MKVVRREFTIFEQMNLLLEKEIKERKGPIESFILTEEEFNEFRINAHNHAASFRKTGIKADGTDFEWTFKGVNILVEPKKKSNGKRSKPEV